MKGDKTVFIGMSGGVDSSVAAYLLKKQGYNAVGVFMRCSDGGSGSTSPAGFRGASCGWEKDAEDARRVAEHLKIPFYVWNFEEEYERRVVRYMIDGYRNGLTPNPDVMCNKEIKFGLFLEKALAAGADYVATGHYVRLEKAECRKENVERVRKRKAPILHSPFSILRSAIDSNKDQSYFLWTLTQQQLQYCLFPIGDYLKPQVREIARKAGLPTAEKKDSQGICFLGNVDVGDFLRQYIAERPGDLMTVDGKKIGEHSGAQFYTIGQRHIKANFQFPMTNGQHQRKPLYVTAKDIDSNTVVVAEGAENPALFRREVNLTMMNFIDPLFANLVKLANRAGGVKVFARVRYRQPLFAAKLTLEDKKWKLIFDQPQKFVASGQSAVFYKEQGTGNREQGGYEMLGGGVIV
ncbi:MAG: tRNA 2-thiouridine(34) synthase MnmA [Patescibacteria group bacterium]|nr:tRNA 2-thiouridine(34) synthase MnmA [Patescibacteria group bacterium]